MFCRSNVQEAKNLEKFLQVFCGWSGECVNVQNSSIHFSNNTAQDLRTEICDILSMPECTHNLKYLGLLFAKVGLEDKRSLTWSRKSEVKVKG